MHAIPSFSAVCLLLALPGCAVLGDPAAERGRERFARADYYQAYHEIVESGVRRDSGEFRTVELAYLFAMGQELVFNDEEQEALAVFETILEREPGHETARLWVAKCKEKLAAKAAFRGDAARHGGDLEAALLAYAEALELVPGFPNALRGRDLVAETLRYRRARAQSHYYDGVRALGDQLWGQTWYHMVNAYSMDPEMDKARERRDDVAQRLERQRFERARMLERTRHFGAALNAYQDLVASGCEIEGVADSVERMRNEVAVQQLIQDAEMAMFRDDFAGARSLLEQAMEQTVAEQVRVTQLLILVRERDLSRRYGEARVLEIENQLEQALEVYRGIATEWDDFKDVRTLISDLETTIEAAAAAQVRGAEAEAAGELEAAIEAYEEALLVYPGYQGLDAKVAELKARLAAAHAGSGT